MTLNSLFSFFNILFLEGVGNYRRKRRTNTYTCQSSRDVPSLYLMYAAKAFNTPSEPPLWKFFPRCMEKIDLPILSVLGSFDLGLLSLLPLLENLVRTTASAVVFLIESQSSLGLYNRLLFINSFKPSNVGMVPNDFVQIIIQTNYYLSWPPQFTIPKEKIIPRTYPSLIPVSSRVMLEMKVEDLQEVEAF